VMSLNPKQQKVVQAEMRTLKEAHGDGLLKLSESLVAAERLAREIRDNSDVLERQWHESVAWLSDYGFVADDKGTLTPRGRTCAAFAEGQPLIIGTIISDGWLPQLSAAEIMAWLCLFLKEARGINDLSKAELSPPVPSAAFEEVLGATYELAEILEVELDRTLTLIMLDWCTHKDIHRIASWIDPHMLGIFVKAVQRVASYVDVTREVLLGLAQYEAYNKLDNHMSVLLGGLVTNESLYLRMDD